MFKIEVKKIKNNGNYFEIKYKTKVEDTKQKEKLEELLEDYANSTYHHNMLRNVAWIKTLVKGSKEIELTVTYKDSTKEETVTYTDGDLLFYKLEKENMTFSNQKYRGYVYNSNKKDSEENKEMYCKMVDYVESLKSIHSIDIDWEQKEMIEAYKLFYGENPNFSSEDTISKIQSMMVVFHYLDVELKKDYYFSVGENNNQPSSSELNENIQSLILLGEIKSFDDHFIDDEVAKKIKSIAQSVKNNFEQNKENMMMFSTMIYLTNVQHETKSITQKEIEEETKKTVPKPRALPIESGWIAVGEMGPRNRRKI